MWPAFPAHLELDEGLVGMEIVVEQPFVKLRVNGIGLGSKNLSKRSLDTALQ